MSTRVLIVEDEALVRWSLRQKFEERDYRVTEAEDGESAMESIDSEMFDILMLDYKLPDMSGLDVLRRLREVDQDAVVVMMTAYGTIETAVEAMKLGAYDYLSKPFQMDELLLTVDKALETTRLRREVRALRREMRAEYGEENIVGRHPTILSLLDTIRRIAESPATNVFLRGETGTGKDLVARVIHYKSDRAARPFVNITCTALSDTLLESELFGHERGAFTDAKSQKKGLVEEADGGTVFLDEIGDMKPALQAKLLRFLEDRRFRRVGGTKEVAVDVRVIAATNRDIEADIEEGRFRQDLYYRLNTITVDLPPLRDRGNDARLLADYFVDRFATDFRKSIHQISEEAYEKLAGYDWPGNVRELKNVIERAVLLCAEETITATDIFLGRSDRRGQLQDWENFSLPASGFALGDLERLESDILRQALDRTDQNQSKAARLLHISRDRLRYRLQKHGLL
jgi:DNA-binding NtrC family response regulator